LDIFQSRDLLFRSKLFAANPNDAASIFGTSATCG
jgi:hypothetical protein